MYVTILILKYRKKYRPESSQVGNVVIFTFDMVGCRSIHINHQNVRNSIQIKLIIAIIKCYVIMSLTEITNE